MTTTVIVAVYDSIANLWGTPYVHHSIQTATRQFVAETTSQQAGILQTNPQDFVLFQLGTYDDANGSIQTLAQPEFIVRGKLSTPSQA